MAGLAAALNVPGAIEPLVAALTSRGPEGASCHIAGVPGVQLDIVVRAVIPSIVRVVAPEPGPSRNGAEQTNSRRVAPPPVVAAIAVDGVASMSALDAGYAADGPSGLLHGREAYAVVLADAERGELVLGRNGGAAGLYYAWHSGGWLVASEPAAFRAAGVEARPDVSTVTRFVVTGAVDDTSATFFDGIAQVLPDEVVALTPDGQARHYHPDTDLGPMSITTALGDAIGQGRIAVLVRPGRLGAAVLGAALSRPDRPYPLPVHTATYLGVDQVASHTPAILAPLPPGTVRHTPHEFDLSTLDLDTFLLELGEPVPDLDLYQLWAVARDLSGGADVVVDSGRGLPDATARVSDRLSARYGVSVRCPVREAAGDADADDLAALINRTLPAAVARYAARETARSATAREIVLHWRDAVVAALSVARPWADPSSSVDAVRRLAIGEPVDADVLLRAYLVERWLSTLELPPDRRALKTAPASRPDQPEAIDVGDAAPNGGYWLRWPVSTKRIAPGAELASTIAFYAEGALAELRTHHGYADALRGPWFAVVAGKVLAVAQQRLSPLWSVESGWLARVLARTVRRRLPLLAQAWTMQVALEEVGTLRLLRAVWAALLRRRRRLEQLLPDGFPVFAPRPEATPPGDSAVVRSPVEPDGFAESLLSALRYSLEADIFGTLAGCAVVRADDTGSRVLGFAAGPFADAVPRAEELVARACADNPVGQGREGTPLVLVFEAPAPRRRDRGRDPRLLDVKVDRRVGKDAGLHK
jgi:hypothetical protein